MSDDGASSCSQIRCSPREPTENAHVRPPRSSDCANRDDERSFEPEASDSCGGPIQAAPLHQAESVPAHELAAADAHLHWFFLVSSLAVLMMSILLNVPGEEKVVLPLAGDLALPGVCSSRELLGVPCPGCGLTRCFICLARGDFTRAWHFNPAGFLLFALVLGQVPYRILQIWRIRRGNTALRPRGWAIFLSAVAVVLVVQWLTKLFGQFFP